MTDGEWLIRLPDFRLPFLPEVASALLHGIDLPDRPANTGTEWPGVILVQFGGVPLLRTGDHRPVGYGAAQFEAVPRGTTPK